MQTSLSLVNKARLIYAPAAYQCSNYTLNIAVHFSPRGKEKNERGKKEGAYSQNKITCQLSIIIRMAYYRNDVSFSSCISVEIYLYAQVKTR